MEAEEIIKEIVHNAFEFRENHLRNNLRIAKGSSAIRWHENALRKWDLLEKDITADLIKAFQNKILKIEDCGIRFEPTCKTCTAIQYGASCHISRKHKKGEGK